MKYYLVFELGNLNNLKVWIDFYANYFAKSSFRIGIKFQHLNACKYKKSIVLLIKEAKDDKAIIFELRQV